MSEGFHSELLSSVCVLNKNCQEAEIKSEWGDSKQLSRWCQILRAQVDGVCLCQTERERERRLLKLCLGRRNFIKKDVKLPFGIWRSWHMILSSQSTQCVCCMREVCGRAHWLQTCPPVLFPMTEMFILLLHQPQSPSNLSSQITCSKEFLHKPSTWGILECVCVCYLQRHRVWQPPDGDAVQLPTGHVPHSASQHVSVSAAVQLVSHLQLIFTHKHRVCFWPPSLLLSLKAIFKLMISELISLSILSGLAVYSLSITHLQI